MSIALSIRGGTVAGIITLAARELGTTTDKRRLYVGTGSTNYILGLQHKIDGTTAPGVNDDDAAGYSTGSQWTDTTNAKVYVCTDSTTGAAVWKQTGGTGVGTVTTVSVVTANNFSGTVANATTTPAITLSYAGQALTKTDDTNVTLTLGGSASTSLIAAASLTLGWTGTLAITRGGTGASTAATARTNLGIVLDALNHAAFGGL